MQSAAANGLSIAMLLLTDPQYGLIHRGETTLSPARQMKP